jgi:hypothetical protein
MKALARSLGLCRKALWNADTTQLTHSCFWTLKFQELDIWASST